MVHFKSNPHTYSEHVNHTHTLHKDPHVHWYMYTHMTSIVLQFPYLGELVCVVHQYTTMRDTHLLTHLHPHMHHTHTPPPNMLMHEHTHVAPPIPLYVLYHHSACTPISTCTCTHIAMRGLDKKRNWKDMIPQKRCGPNQHADGPVRCNFRSHKCSPSLPSHSLIMAGCGLW